jgi:hypothetical protein
MRSRSSTFSFETLRLDATVRPLGAILAALILIAIDATVARTDWIWARVPTSQGGMLDAVERTIVDPAPDPKVLIMGSSRIHDAVLPRTLERSLDLDEGTVLNLGISAGTPFDALTLYRRNRQKLRHARAMVVGVDDWQFNGGFPPSECDRRFMTLAERIGVFRSDATLSLIAGWAWKTYDAEAPIRRLLEDFVHRTPHAIRIDDEGRIVMTPGAREVGPLEVDVRPDVDRFYARWTLSPGRIAELETLIRLAQEDGLAVFLTQVPLRAAYVDVVEQRFGAADAEYRRGIASIAGVEIHLFARASELGIPENHYVDYGHLTRPGAERMTAAIARWLDSILKKP